MKWLFMALFTLAAGCTFMHISGSDNSVTVDKAGTDVKTDTEVITGEEDDDRATESKND